MTSEDTISRSYICNIVKPRFILDIYSGIHCIEDYKELDPVRAQDLIMGIEAIGKLCNIELRHDKVYYR